MPTGKTLRRFLLVAGVAAALRLLHLWLLRDFPPVRALLLDARSYTEWAARIAGGDWLGQEVFYQAPLYPYALALLRLAGVQDPLAIRAVQALAGGASCGLLYLAARRFTGEGAALAAGLLLATHAPAIFFDGIIQKTVLDTLFTCALLLGLGSAQRRPRGRAWLAAGAALGCLALTRENALLFALVVPAWIAWRFRSASWPRRAAWAGTFALGAAALLLPVGARNARFGGDFLPTTSQMGPNFYIGNNPRATGSYVPLRAGREDPRFERADAVELAEAAAGRDLSDREVSDYWMARSREFIRDRPGAWLALLARKGLLVWNRDEIADTEDYPLYRGRSWVLRALGAVNHFGVLLPLALAGAVLAWRERRDLAILYALSLALAAGVALFFVFARYRFPIVPALAILAGTALVRAVAAWRAGCRRALGAAAAAAAAGAIVSALPLTPAYDPAPGLMNVALASEELGDAAGAERTYRDILARRPEHVAARFNLAVLLAERGRFDQAAAEYRQVLERDPANAGALNNLAVLFTGEGAWEEAAALYRRAAEAAPGDPRAWSNLASVLARTGRMEEAREAGERAVAADDRNAGAHSNYGVVLLQTGDPAGAVAAFRRSLALDPAAAGTWGNLGIALEASGDPAGAEEAYRRSLALDPRDGNVRARLERVAGYSQRTSRSPTK